jgi:hypothetical protein
VSSSASSFIRLFASTFALAGGVPGDTMRDA